MSAICYECDKEIKTIEDFIICKELDCHTEICKDCAIECDSCERYFCSEHLIPFGTCEECTREELR